MALPSYEEASLNLHERLERQGVDRRLTIGEVENERLRMAGLDECPMYEPDYNEGWR